MKLPRGVGRAALGQGAVRRTVMARGRALKFAFCMSLFNSVLLLNKEKGVGRTNWDSPEGVDVCAEINQIFASTSTPSTRHSHHKHDVCSTAWR